MSHTRNRSGRGQIYSEARSDRLSHTVKQSWPETAECKAALASCRRAVIEDGIGRMSMNTAQAAERLVDMALMAQSEAVRCAAARAILLARLQIVELFDLELRITELERTADDVPDHGPTGGY
jgi:hypothetical protein